MFVCIGAVPALFKTYLYLIRVDFGIQGEGYCLFNVYLLLFWISISLFPLFCLHITPSLPPNGGGYTLFLLTWERPFCWFVQVFTTLSSQLQRQGPKDKRGDKQIFHFTLFFWCTEFQGRDLGLLRVLMGSAYNLCVQFICIFGALVYSCSI